MENLHMNEHSIFLAALEIADPNQRAAYLDQACADDPSLRKQVDALLVAHERSGEFLDVPALKQMAAGVAVNANPGGETSVVHHGAQGEIDLSFLQPSTVPVSLGRLLHYEVREVVGRGGCPTHVRRCCEERKPFRMRPGHDPHCPSGFLRTIRDTE